MTRRTRLVSLVATFMMALPALAMAGNRPMSPERAACRAKRDAKHLPTYDTNKDGALDRQERQALRQDRRAQALKTYDADRDGQLSDAERQKLHGDRVAKRFGVLDANRDGGISRAEANVPCAPIAHHFDKVDANKDDRVSLAELSAARRFKGKHHRGMKGGRGGARPGGAFREQ